MYFVKRLIDIPWELICVCVRVFRYPRPPRQIQEAAGAEDGSTVSWDAFVLGYCACRNDAIGFKEHDT